MTSWRPLAAVAAICCTAMASCVSHGDSGRVERVGQASEDLVTNCKYLDQSQYPPLPVDVDFDRELVIRDLTVVEDPCRTTWAPTVACAPGTVGVWTFKQLMTAMAGTTPPEQFVAEWLSTFETSQTINTFPVPARADVRPALIDPWLEASGCPAGSPIVGPGACTLKLEIAPFRLLAIVNRVDLAGPAYGADNPGEARFVFGMLQLPHGGKAPPPLFGPDGQLLGSPLKGTTIFEYRVPPIMKLPDWAGEWHDLSSIPLGDPKFNEWLQHITDQFSTQGADGSRPNLGSSIGQVRTNEISLGNNDWELREFTLQDAGRGFDGFALQNTTTKQTPDDSVNNTTPLDGWLLANEPLILDVDHVVPDDVGGNPLLGGVSRETSFVWGTSVTPPMDPLARHHFALTACNGCHTNATQTSFTHIDNRSLGAAAPLSGFLGQSPAPDPSFNGLPASVQTVPDDMFPSISREYNEPWRRVCEVNRILRGDPDPYTRGNGGVH